MSGMWTRIRAGIPAILAVVGVVSTGTVQAAAPLPLRWQQPIGLVGVTTHGTDVFFIQRQGRQTQTVAYNLSSGTLDHTYSSLTPVLGEGALPVMTNDTIYVVGNHDLQAANMRSGKRVIDTTLLPASSPAFLASLRVAGSVILVQSATMSGSIARLFAVDAASGHLLWSRPATDWVADGSTVALDNTLVHARSGKVIATLPRVAHASWTAFGGHFFRQRGLMPTSDTLQAYTPAGHLLWTRRDLTAQVGTATVAWGYTSTGLVAIQPSTGRILRPFPGLTMSSTAGLGLSATSGSTLYTLERVGAVDNVIALIPRGHITHYTLPSAYRRLQGSIEVSGKTLLVESAVPGGAPFKLAALSLP